VGSFAEAYQAYNLNLKQCEPNSRGTSKCQRWGAT